MVASSARPVMIPGSAMGRITAKLMTSLTEEPVARDRERSERAQYHRDRGRTEPRQHRHLQRVADILVAPTRPRTTSC